MFHSSLLQIVIGALLITSPLVVHATVDGPDDIICEESRYTAVASDCQRLIDTNYFDGRQVVSNGGRAFISDGTCAAVIRFDPSGSQVTTRSDLATKGQAILIACTRDSSVSGTMKNFGAGHSTYCLMNADK